MKPTRRALITLLMLISVTGCSITGDQGAGGSATADPVSSLQSPAAVSAEVSPQPAPQAITTEVTTEVTPEVTSEVTTGIDKKYSGFVHKDSFVLKQQGYEVYYWNTGEFSYTQFVVTKNKEIVFDSQQAGVEIEGGYIFDKEQDVWAEAVLQNDRPTFLFELMDNRPDSAFIVLEEIEGALQLTIHDDFALYYLDVDHEGPQELVAYPYSGQLPLGPALEAVYELKDRQYVPNLTKTLHYWEEALAQRNEAYRNEPSEFHLNSLLSAYLLLGRQEEARAQFPELYKRSGQNPGDGGFVQNYEQILQQGDYAYLNGWMNKLKPLKKVQ